MHRSILATSLVLALACGSPSPPVAVEGAAELAERATWLARLHSPATDRVARSLLDEAALIEPGHPSVLALRAELEARGGLGSRPAGVKGPPPERRQALQELEDGLLASPGDQTLVLAVARMHFAFDHPERGLELVDGLLREHPDHAEALLRRGEALVKLERPHDAEGVLQASIRSAMEQGDTLTVFQAQGALGEAWLQLGQVERAERYLGEASAELAAYRAAHPGKTTVNCPHETLAKLYSGRGDYAEAAEHARDAADLRAWLPRLQYLAALASVRAEEPSVAQVYYQRGVAKERGGGPSPLRGEVEAALREGSETPPPSAEQAVAVAVSLLELGRADLATAELRPWVTDNSCGDCLLVAGFAALEDGDEPAARALLERVGEGEGRSVGMAQLALLEGRAEEARAIFTPSCGAVDAGVSGAPSAVTRMACLGLGASALAVDDDNSAADAFGRVLAAHPDDLPALLGRGNASNGLGRSVDALEHFQRALMIAPDDPQALAGIGTALLNSGEHALAADVFRVALEVAPEGWSCPHEGLGLVLLAQGDAEGARETLERAVAVDPDSDFRKYDALARMAIDAGDTERARGLLERSLANNPAGVDAGAMLEEIGAPD